MQTTTAERRIRQARTALLRKSRFMGALALRLDKLEADTSIPYMATDGKALKYNPEAILKDSLDNIVTGIAHEAAHCACQHFARRGSRDPKNWNVAADYAANPLLADAGFTLAETDLYSAAWHGWSAERIYLELAKNPPTQEEQDKAARGQVDDSPQSGDGSEDGQEDGQQGAAKGQGAALAQEWAEALQEAANVAIAQGNAPAGLVQAVRNIATKAQDWRAIMQHFATDPARDESRWTPPNRRHVWRGAYLPGMRSNEVSCVALVIDTSGSIDSAQQAAFIAEGRAMLESGLVSEVAIIAADADAWMIGRFGRGDPITVDRLPGGGGTDFAPAFRLIEAEGLRPTCAVYLTDLLGSFPPAPPEYPVLWVTTYPGRAPFGTVIDMD